MKVTIEERPLEKLENEIVEYIIKTPNNANPNVVRTMVSAAAENVSLGSNGKPVYFKVYGSDSTSISHIDGSYASIEEIIPPCLDGTLAFLSPQYYGGQQYAGIRLPGDDGSYMLNHITGFQISGENLLWFNAPEASFIFEGGQIGKKAQEIATSYFANL